MIVLRAKRAKKIKKRPVEAVITPKIGVIKMNQKNTIILKVAIGLWALVDLRDNLPDQNFATYELAKIAFNQLNKG